MNDWQAILFTFFILALYVLPGCLIQYRAVWKEVFEEQEAALIMGNKVIVSPEAYWKLQQLKKTNSNANSRSKSYSQFGGLNLIISNHVPKKKVKIGQERVTCFGNRVAYTKF